MAQKILKQFMLSLCLWLLPTMMHAQGQGYKTDYTWSTTDITVQATSGTNAWKSIYQSPTCKPNTLSVATDLSLWCINAADGYVYMFSTVNKTWAKQTALSTVSTYIVAQNTQNIYSLQLISDCGVGGGVQFYALFRWDVPTSKFVNLGKCATQVSVGADGFIAVDGWDGATQQRALYYSTDNGATWILWSDGWTFVSVENQNDGCAISSSGVIYQVGLSNSFTKVHGITTGTPAGCIKATGAFIAWNTAGTVYLLKSDNSGWNAISGLSVKQVVGGNKAFVFALDASGKSYHWNVYAPSITATMTGTFDNFPMNMNPIPHHTGTIRVRFPHGINTAAASSQTIPYNGSLDVYYSDTAPRCDPFYGSGTNDSECVPNTDVNEALCTVAGPLTVATEYPPVGPFYSMDVRSFLYDTGNDSGPTLNGTPLEGVWVGVVEIYTSSGCTIGFPTCPYVDNGGPQLDDEWYEPFLDDGDGLGSAAAEGKVLNGMRLSRAGKTAPWTYPVPYFINSDGTHECNYPPPRTGAIAMYQGLIQMPCQ